MSSVCCWPQFFSRRSPRFLPSLSFVLVLVLVLGKIRPWLIWPLLALVGWTNLASRTAVVSPNDLRALLGNDAAIVTVRGNLVETPHIKIIERDDQQTEHTARPSPGDRVAAG